MQSRSSGLRLLRQLDQVSEEDKCPHANKSGHAYGEQNSHDVSSSSVPPHWPAARLLLLLIGNRARHCSEKKADRVSEILHFVERGGWPNASERFLAPTPTCIRLPARVRALIAADAGGCGLSFCLLLGGYEGDAGKHLGPWGAATMTDGTSSNITASDADLRNLARIVSACTLGLWAFAAGLLIGTFMFS